MKKIGLFGMICAVSLLGCVQDIETSSSASETASRAVSASPNALYSVKQKINMEDCGAVIYNPDMGFYRTGVVRITPKAINGTSVSAVNVDTSEIDGIIKSKPVNTEKNGSKYSANKTYGNLIHLEFDISSFSKVTNKKADFSMEKNALSAINQVFEKLKSNGKTAVIRFAYDPDYDGHGEDGKAIEPENFDVILNHVREICRLAKNNREVITAVECGLIGPWGEMHATPYAEKSKDGKLKGYIVEVMKTYITELRGYELPLLVRQPRFIYCYLTDNTTYNGASIPSAVTPKKDEDIYRLGMYNDGYLESKSDCGTFKLNREDEIKFLKPFTNHTPYGGELIGKYGFTKGSSQDLKQLSNVHLSFLNIEWNKNVFRELDSSSYKVGDETVFKYLLKHMGYRYLVKDSYIKYYDGNTQLKVKLTLNNEGFAELPYHRTKRLKLYYVKAGTKNPDENAICVDSIQGDFKGNFEGKTDYTVGVKFPVPASLASGDYDVYLKICDKDGSYPIRLANKDMWNETLKANKVGIFTK